ncbi:helix-turn-helix domain-containing protein [uncultured Sphingomonas sp.]
MVGERIKDRLVTLEISQAELARRVKLSQPAINGLIRGATRSSTHLHRIARALSTSAAYLEGETDDPDENAPPPLPPPTVQHLMMPVALPSEAALAAAFEAQLRVFGDLQGAELARALARRLPSALGRLQAAALYEETVAGPADDEDQQPPEQARPESRRAQRR